MKILHIFKLFCLCFLSLIFAACSTTQMGSVGYTSGFLNDYSRLSEDASDETLMTYIDPDVDFDQYNKIIIEPIQLITSKDSEMAEISSKDRQAIADYIYAALTEKLSEKYTIASEPGPQTMTLRVALTDITESEFDPVTMTSIYRHAMPVKIVIAVATTNYLTIGSATGEMELLDSTTGKRLMAAMDGRYGKRKYPGQISKWDNWKDVKDVCDYWVDLFVRRLDELSKAGK